MRVVFQGRGVYSSYTSPVIENAIAGWWNRVENAPNASEAGREFAFLIEAAAGGEVFGLSNAALEAGVSGGILATTKGLARGAAISPYGTTVAEEISAIRSLGSNRARYAELDVKISSKTFGALLDDGFTDLQISSKVVSLLKEAGAVEAASAIENKFVKLVANREFTVNDIADMPGLTAKHKAIIYPGSNVFHLFSANLKNTNLLEIPGMAAHEITHYNWVKEGRRTGTQVSEFAAYKAQDAVTSRLMRLRPKTDEEIWTYVMKVYGKLPYD